MNTNLNLQYVCLVFCGSGFSELDLADQEVLFKQGSFELILTRYTRCFTVDGMMTPDMTNIIPRLANDLQNSAI